jgi:putative transposase
MLPLVISYPAPLYCLMPDHVHLLLLGQGEGCDQLNAIKYIRRHWNQSLKPMGFQLQAEAYDHILNETERNPSAFEDTCLYIANNPQRANLAKDWRRWTALGSIVAGYPDLDPRDLETFWPTFWKIHNRETAPPPHRCDSTSS